MELQWLERGTKISGNNNIWDGGDKPTSTQEMTYIKSGLQDKQKPVKCKIMKGK